MEFKLMNQTHSQNTNESIADINPAVFWLVTVSVYQTITEIWIELQMLFLY